MWLTRFQRAIDGSLSSQYESHYRGVTERLLCAMENSCSAPQPRALTVYQYRIKSEKLTRNSSNRTALRTHSACEDYVTVSLPLVSLTTVLCADRVGQMTKTYNDIDAVTRLLEEVIVGFSMPFQCHLWDLQSILPFDALFLVLLIRSIGNALILRLTATVCSNASLLTVSPLLHPTERARSGVGGQNRPVAAEEEQNSDWAEWLLGGASGANRRRGLPSERTHILHRANHEI